MMSSAGQETVSFLYNTVINSGYTWNTDLREKTSIVRLDQFDSGSYLHGDNTIYWNHYNKCIESTMENSDQSKVVVKQHRDYICTRHNGDIPYSKKYCSSYNSECIYLFSYMTSAVIETTADGLLHREELREDVDSTAPVFTELLTGDVSVRTSNDVYSTGIYLYEKYQYDANDNHTVHEVFGYMRVGALYYMVNMESCVVSHCCRMFQPVNPYSVRSLRLVQDTVRSEFMAHVSSAGSGTRSIRACGKKEAEGQGP
ncbi:MAG: hypothetical protein ACOC2H_02565 [Spirochaetota bacterium]